MGLLYIYIYIYIYIRHRASRHARACSRQCLVVWLSCFLVFLRGPQPRDSFSRTTRAPIFEHFLHHFFRTHFFTTPASKMVTQGAPREPPKHQNRVKMTSCAGLQKKGWKKLRKSAFSGKLDMQSAHACAVQTHFFVFAIRPEKWSKKPPKSSSKSSKIHQKTLLEPCQNSCRKSWHAKRKKI